MSEHAPVTLKFTTPDSTAVISKNFTAGEFNSEKLSTWYVSETLVRLLQNIRNQVGKPLRINSGYRSHPGNLVAGGAKNSEHLYGDAADLAVPSGLTPMQLASIGYQCGCRRIGIGNTFVHIGVRPTPEQGLEFWTYGQRDAPTRGEFMAYQENYKK